MAVTEPQHADDYGDRTTAAVKAVLVEIGQILGSFRGKFAVIGGAVPWLLLSEPDMPHSGTIDVDLGLDPFALGDGEYAQLVEALLTHGYDQRANLRRFQLVRTVPARDGGPDIDIVVDFLMPRDAEITRNTPPLISQFAVQRADGAELALRFYQMVAIVRNFPGGIEALVEATRPLLDVKTARKGYRLISGKFRNIDDFGPTSVRGFVEDSHLLGGRTATQWQQDAFGQVDAWLRGLGLR